MKNQFSGTREVKLLCSAPLVWVVNEAYLYAVTLCFLVGVGVGWGEVRNCHLLFQYRLVAGQTRANRFGCVAQPIGANTLGK